MESNQENNPSQGTKESNQEEPGQSEQSSQSKQSNQSKQSDQNQSSQSEKSSQSSQYNALLEKLYKEVKQVKATERFEIPKVEGHIEGNKTIITNFLQICSVIRRKPEHLAKFLFRELAVQGSVEKERLVLNRKLSSRIINEKIEAYVKEFVICPECGKPDTELIKEGKFMFIHCLACGAKHAVRAKIA